MSEFNWDSYRELKEWNESFGIDISNDPNAFDEDMVHQVFSLMQGGLCDREIHQITNIHEFYINKMRGGSIYSVVGSQYDYPIVFTRELMMNRIRIMIHEENLSIPDIVDRTGVNINVVADMYQRIQNDKIFFNRHYNEQKRQQLIEDRQYDGKLYR